MNAVLQFWSGPITELTALSSVNMGRYAKLVGADYQLIRDGMDQPNLSPQAGKLVMLAERFDAYETVTMVDCDQFAVTGLRESIFDVSGFGWHHDTAHPRVVKAFPALAGRDAVFVGGAVYRLPLWLRRALRAEIDWKELRQFDNPAGGWDEGMMHRLMLRARVPVADAYFSKRWCQDNAANNPAAAAFIHVRARPSRDKLENYRALVEKGIIT